MSLDRLESGPNIEAFDIDDTLLMREEVTRFAGFLKGMLNPKLLQYTANINTVDHTPIDRPISGWREQLAFDFHRKRRAFPGIADKLKTKTDQGKKLIALSGRDATRDWYEMTLEQLRREDIPITEVLLTPAGVSTAVSKAHGILYLNAVEFSDDDLRTQIFLSGTFPDRQFYWIRHGLTNIPVTPAIEEVLLTRSNLKVVPSRDWANPSSL